MFDSLNAIYRTLPTRGDCLDHLERVLWSDGKPQCPYCGYRRATSLPVERRHHCNACNTSYSVLVGTPLHGTRVDIQKWIYAMHIVLFEDPKITVRALADRLQLNRQTAWRILSRIRQTQASRPLFLFTVTSFEANKRDA